MQTASSTTGFECPVCFERFNDSDHAPKSLPCGHSFCLKCLSSLPTNHDILNAMPPLTPPVVIQECSMCKKTKRPVIMHCETCNLHLCLGHSETHQDDNEDHVLLPYVQEHVSNMCPRHPEKVLEGYCIDCSVCVCSSCFMFNHSGHKCLDIQGAFDKLKPSIESSISRAMIVCGEMNAMVDDLKDLERHLSVKETDIASSIRESFNQIHASVDARGEALISSLPSKRLAVESHRHAIESQSNQLSICSQSSQVHLDSNDKLYCLSNADPLIALLSSLDDETKSDDWRQIKYDRHLELKCDIADLMQCNNYLDQLNSSNDHIKAINDFLDEMKLELPQSIATICTPIDDNLSTMSWNDVETALTAVVTALVENLDECRSECPFPNSWLDVLFKPYLSELNRVVSEKRASLKMTWDISQRVQPCLTELDCRRVVVAILKETRGAANWNGPDDKGNRFNWSEDLPLGEWDGIAPPYNVKRIQVDGNGMIKKLCMNCLGMRGMFPDSIGNLTSLTGLDVRYNQLTRLPDSIGDLASLTRLNVSDNQLTQLPDSIGNLTSLCELYVSDNPLTSTQGGRHEVNRRFGRAELALFVD